MQMKCCVAFLVNFEQLSFAGVVVTFSKASQATLLRIRVVLETSSSLKDLQAYKAFVNESYRVKISCLDQVLLHTPMCV